MGFFSWLFLILGHVVGELVETCQRPPLLPDTAHHPLLSHPRPAPHVMSWLKKFLPIGEERRPGVNYGFQVLKNTNTFVAIEPWFDFICGINGRLVVRPPPSITVP